MDVLVGKKSIPIDFFGMVEEIDDVFHSKLTSKTGVTVNHHYIELFVAYVIEKHNQKEKQQEEEWDKLLDKSMEKSGELLKLLSK